MLISFVNTFTNYEDKRIWSCVVVRFRSFLICFVPQNIIASPIPLWSMYIAYNLFDIQDSNDLKLRTR